jgi:hypothetical protein
MTEIKITNRYDGSVLYQCEAESVKDAVNKAIKANADLSSADLSYANLSYANLSSANLRSADLSYANLRYANLRYANLSSADLSYANLLIYQSDIWICYIQPDMIRIGCQYHQPATWEAYSDNEISQMEARALAWWQRHKAAIFAIHSTFKTEAKDQP